MVVVAPVTARSAGSLGGVVSAGDGTTSVGADVAVLEPPALLAVTATRSVEPTSAASTPNVEAVASGISTQPAPLASHRRHWYVRVRPLFGE